MEPAIFLLHHQTFLPRNPEISVRWFLLKPVWAQGWQGKRKQIGSILLRYQPSVTCNFRTALKSTFDFTEMWTNGSGSEEQCVFMPDLFPNCHRSLASLASDYHEKNEVKDFLAHNFLLGYLSDLRKLPWIWVTPSKTPMEEFIF